MTRKKTTESASEVAAKVVAATKPRRPSAKDRANGRGGAQLTGQAKVEYDRRVANQRAANQKEAAAAKKTAAKATGKEQAATRTTGKKTAAAKAPAKKTATKKTAAKKAAPNGTPLAQTRHLPHKSKGGTPHPGPVWHQVLKDMGLSQAAAADLMGVAPMTLNRFLNGHGIPSCRVTIAFARATNRDIAATWQEVADYELAMTLESGA